MGSDVGQLAAVADIGDGLRRMTDGELVRRHVTCDHAACSDDRVGPDRHALQDVHVRRNPRVVVDQDRRRLFDVLVIDVAEDRVAAPSDLDATVSKKDVGLAWSDNATNEAGFQVDRGKKTKGVVRYTKVSSVGPNITRYAEALAPGTYYFRVKAFGPGGAASAHSNVVKVSIKVGGKGPS